MRKYFPKPFTSFGGYNNAKGDLSNYATKTDIKNISHVDTSNFAVKANFDSLKTEIGKLDIDKLGPVPVDFRNLSKVVKNEVVKTVYDKPCTEVNNIETGGFFKKTKYDADLENQI